MWRINDLAEPQFRAFITNFSKIGTELRFLYLSGDWATRPTFLPDRDPPTWTRGLLVSGRATKTMLTRYGHMKTRNTYKRSLSIMAGLAIAIAAGIGFTGGQMAASIGTASSEHVKTSEAKPQGGYTVVYKDPNGPWPGEEQAGSRTVEVAAGVFVDRNAGFDI